MSPTVRCPARINSRRLLRPIAAAVASSPARGQHVHSPPRRSAAPKPPVSSPFSRSAIPLDTTQVQTLPLLPLDTPQPLPLRLLVSFAPKPSIAVARPCSRRKSSLRSILPPPYTVVRFLMPASSSTRRRPPTRG